MENEDATRFYDNGQIRFELPTLDGKRHGLQRWWYENGNIHFEYHALNGIQIGLQTRWHESGTLDVFQTHKQRSRCGVYMTFHYYVDWSMI